MRYFFGVITIGLVIASVSGAAAAWDGAYFLVEMLDKQMPVVVHNRMLVIPLHWLVILASHFTSNIGILTAILGLAYGLIPLASLVISWWAVRDNARPLFVWAVFGIGIATLPGQFCFTTEATGTLQLFWPILLILLTRLSPLKILVLILLNVAIFFHHPSSLLLFAFEAFVVGIVGWLRWKNRLAIISLVILLISLSFVRGLLINTTYETERLSVELYIQSFRTSVFGLPLIALISSWISATLMFVAAYLFQYSKSKKVYVLRSLELVGLIITSIVLIIWSSDPKLWSGVLGYRTWALACSLPFMIIAVLEGIVGRSYLLNQAQFILKNRYRAMQIISMTFMLVLAIQSVKFVGLSNQIKMTIAQSRSSCINRSELGYINKTLFNHWSITSYAILLQSRTPEKVILSGDACKEQNFTVGFPLAEYDSNSKEEYYWHEGWFNMKNLELRLKNEGNGALYR